MWCTFLKICLFAHIFVSSVSFLLIPVTLHEKRCISTQWKKLCQLLIDGWRASQDASPCVSMCQIPKYESLRNGAPQPFLYFLAMWVVWSEISFSFCTVLPFFFPLPFCFCLMCPWENSHSFPLQRHALWITTSPLHWRNINITLRFCCGTYFSACGTYSQHHHRSL